MDLVTPSGLWELARTFRSGDAHGLNLAVDFLEVDPWFFRSGYLKHRLIFGITRLELDESVRSRLSNVVLAAVDRRNRVEFRAYCRLARAVRSVDLDDALQERLESGDEGVRRRAGWGR